MITKASPKSAGAAPAAEPARSAPQRYRSPRRDRYNLPLSTCSTLAVERYVEGIDLLLSWNVGAEERLHQALEADDGFALAHAALAIIHRFRGQVDAARACAAQACALATGTTRREHQHCLTIAAFVEQPPDRALALLREHLAEYPRDAVPLSLSLFLVARSGAIDWQQQLFALLNARAATYGDDWWFLGVYALAHEELDRIEEARRLAERSLARNPRNAGAAHPLAHVFYETDDHASGTGFLSGWLADYDRTAPFHCHLSWHLALALLLRGHVERALQVYQRQIAPKLAAGPAALTDAASLLWRVQIYGGTRQPPSWGGVARLARTVRPGMPLVDVHAALTLAATGDEAALAQVIDGLDALAAQGDRLAEDVVLPLVHGIGAFSRGEYAEAVCWLEPVANQVVRIGGSNAQREILEETLLVARLRAGHVEQAASLLRKRLGRRPSARDLSWLQGLPPATAATVAPSG